MDTRRPAARWWSVYAFLVCIAVASGSAAAEDEVSTKHIHVRGELDEKTLDAFAHLAEAAYPQWKEYFGAEPKKDWMPLELRVLKDRDSFLAALKAVGVGGDFAGAGGYYDPGSKTSFLYPQPHMSSTRLLVLHELTHQFQYKAVQDNRGDRSPLWQKEGIAEHFGFHRRTTDGVETGALDVVAIDDRPAQFADRYRAGKFDPWAIGTDAAGPVDYTDSLGMVEMFLRTTDTKLRETFHEWEKDVYKGVTAGPHFARAFRGMKERLERAAKEVWGDWRRTWKIIYVAWDEEPGVVVGKGMPWAVLIGGAPLPKPYPSIEATITLSQGAVAGGIALGMKGPEDLIVLELRPGGALRMAQKKAGVWRELGSATSAMGAAGGALRLRLLVQGPDLVAEAGGIEAIRVSTATAGILPADLEGAAGLTAETGEVRFAGLKTGG